MFTKFAGRQRFVDHLLCAIGALAAAACHTKALPKLAQGSRAFTYGVANLAFGNPIAEANVHGAPKVRVKEC